MGGNEVTYLIGIRLQCILDKCVENVASYIHVVVEEVWYVLDKLIVVSVAECADD